MHSDLKYDLIPTSLLSPNNEPLFQIRALRDIGSDYYLKDVSETFIEKGTLGGLVSNENNLSQFGDSWIFPNGIVFDQGYVGHDCRLYSGLIGGNARFLNALCINIHAGDLVMDGIYEGYGVIKKAKDCEKYNLNTKRKRLLVPQGP